MRKKLLLLFTIFALCFTLVSCKDKNSFYKTETISGQEHFDEIKGVKEISFLYSAEKFNDDKLKEVNNFIDNEIKELTAYYPTDFADFFVDPESDWSINMIFDEEYNSRVVYNTEDLVSIEIDNYEYTGGAHGMTFNYAKNYDVKNNKFLNMSDVFTEGFEEELYCLIEESLTEDEEMYGLFPEFRDSISFIFNDESDAFYFSENGINFIYGEYLIAPYAAGNIHVEIPYEKLNNILKEEYKR